MRERAAAFFRRHPLLGAALVAALCVLAADGGAERGWVAALLAAAAGAWIGWRRGLVWCVCGLVAVANFQFRSAKRDHAERELGGWSGGEITAKLLADPRGDRSFWAGAAELRSGPHAGVRIEWRGDGPVPVEGSVVRATGRFRPFTEPRNPGEFDEAGWMRRQGTAGIFHADRRKTAAETGRLAALGFQLRRGFRAAVTAGLEEDSRPAQVIRAVVLGERPRDGGKLAEPFRHSGTLHVFCVSGLHVGMVGLLAWLALSRLGFPRRWAVLGILPLAFSYAWLTGNGPPAVRASWMMAVFLGAFVLRRKPDALNALGAVLLASMLWDGRLLFQPGVQLSYGVVACIALGISWISKSYAWMAEPELYLPESLMTRWQRLRLNARRKIAGSLAVSTAAWFGSTPLTALHFGLVTPASIPATVVMLPIVFVLLAAALVSATLHPVLPGASRTINRSNAALARVCTFTAESFAALPGSHFRLGQSREPFLLVLDLDYGAGAAVFAGGNGGGALIDCGDRRGFRRQVLPALRHFAVVPDAVAITHPDGSHLGGGLSVWDELPIRQALLPVERSLSPAFRKWRSEAPAAGVRLHPTAGKSGVPLAGGAWLEILHTPDPRAIHVIADDRVAIYRLHWRGWRILFTSDAGHATESALLRSGKDLAADVIVAGRHERDDSLGDDFLDAVRPRAIIASNADFPPEQRLPETQAAYWRSRGILVIDQRETGGVTLRVDAAGQMRIESYLEPRSAWLER